MKKLAMFMFAITSILLILFLSFDDSGLSLMIAIATFITGMVCLICKRHPGRYIVLSLLLYASLLCSFLFYGFLLYGLVLDAVILIVYIGSVQLIGRKKSTTEEYYRKKRTNRLETIGVVAVVGQE